MKKYFALLQGDLTFLKLEPKFDSLTVVSHLDYSETNFSVFNENFRFESAGFTS